MWGNHIQIAAFARMTKIFVHVIAKNRKKTCVIGEEVDVD